MIELGRSIVKGQWHDRYEHFCIVIVFVLDHLNLRFEVNDFNMTIVAKMLLYFNEPKFSSLEISRNLYWLGKRTPWLFLSSRSLTHLKVCWCMWSSKASLTPTVLKSSFLLLHRHPNLDRLWIKKTFDLTNRVWPCNKVLSCYSTILFTLTCM